MSDSTSILPDPARNYLQREYYSRIIAYLAAAAIVAAGTFMEHFSYEIIWMVPYALIYPHLAQQLSKRFSRESPRRIGINLLLLDALNTGMAIALLDYPAVPGLMLLTIISFIAMILGGLRSMLLVLLVSCSAAVLIGVATGSPMRAYTPVAV